MNTIAITCPECRDSFPAVLDCQKCEGYGKLIIRERRHRRTRWPRWAAWGALALVAIGALLWGWLSR